MEPITQPTLLLVVDIPFFTSTAMIILCIGMILAFIRMLKGPSLPDRVVALDVIAMIAIGMMVLFAIVAEQPLFLDVAIAMALIVFLGTVAFARCFEKKVTD